VAFLLNFFQINFGVFLMHSLQLFDLFGLACIGWTRSVVTTGDHKHHTHHPRKNKSLHNVILYRLTIQQTKKNKKEVPYLQNAFIHLRRKKFWILNGAFFS